MKKKKSQVKPARLQGQPVKGETQTTRERKESTREVLTKSSRLLGICKFGKISELGVRQWSGEVGKSPIEGKNSIIRRCLRGSKKKRCSISRIW